MIIYQVHDKHGKHISYSPLEAANNRKAGWRDVTEKEFYGQKPQIEVIQTVQAIPVQTTSQETPKEAHPAPKRRGRKPKVKHADSPSTH